MRNSGGSAATPSIAHGVAQTGQADPVDPEAELREYLEQLGRFVSSRPGVIRHGFVLLSVATVLPRRRRHTTQELPDSVLQACAERSR